MRRVEGWDTRLSDLFEEYRHEPFQWGFHDCCTFAKRDYEIMLGVSPVGMPSWTDYASAAALVQYKTLADWLTEILGDPVEGWMTARRGDVVLIEGASPQDIPGALGVLGVVGGSMIACTGLDGIAFVPLSRAARTWSVGD